MSQWTMGRMATRRRVTACPSAKSAADRALDHTSTCESRRARPAARRTEWGADDDGDPSLAELPRAPSRAWGEIEKRNAQRELEAAQEDTRRRGVAARG